MNTNNIVKSKEFTKEQKEWSNMYRHTLNDIGCGLVYDCRISTPNKVEKRLSTDQFSTNYKTREEFDKDRNIILEYLGDMKYPPKSLVQKVSETVKELDLQYGE